MNLVLLLISAFYWLFSTGTLKAFFYLEKKETVTKDIKRYSLLIVSCVFLFCGIHYLTEYLRGFSATWFDALVLLPVAVYLGVSINYFTVDNYIDDLEQLFTTTMTERAAKELLRDVKKQNFNMLVVVKLLEPMERLEVLWYTDHFYDWATELCGELPKDLTGMNWYELFPIKDKWKKEHIYCNEHNQPLSDDCEYWEECDRYLRWRISPKEENDTLFFSFTDITTLKKSQMKLQQQRDDLLALGLNRISLGGNKLPQSTNQAEGDSVNEIFKNGK